MVSTSHPNAKELFERDVDGVVNFFERKLGYLPEGDEALDRVRPVFEQAISQGLGTLDEELKASGFKKEHQTALEKFIIGRKGEESDSEDSEEESEEESENEGDGEAEGSSSGSEDAKQDAVSEGSVASSSGRLGMEAASSGDGGLSDDESDTPEAGPEEGVSRLELSEAAAEAQLAQQQAAAVAHRAAEQRRRAARRAAMAKASRNASKGKNAGKKKGEGNGGVVASDFHW